MDKKKRKWKNKNSRIKTSENLTWEKQVETHFKMSQQAAAPS